MEQSSCLLLPTLVLAILSPGLCLPGEKFRINPDDIERVKQMSNMTDGRDRTAKNVNFAWKQTIQSTVVVMTTQDPKYTSTLDPEMQKKNNEIYDKLFAQLAYTLRDKEYLNRWLTEMDKGYHIFLYEIQKQARKYEFVKRDEQNPDAFEGSDGEFLHVCMVDFLRALGNKAEFDIFFDSLKDRMDLFKVKTTLSAAHRNASLNQAYNLMFLQLAHTLRNPEYRHRWMSSNLKGFDSFLRDLKEFGVKWFIRPMPDDDSFVGEKGEMFWENIVMFMQYSQQSGFDALIKKIDSLPNNFEPQDVININLPDVGQIMADAHRSGSLTPINWDLYKITTQPMGTGSTSRHIPNYYKIDNEAIENLVKT